MAKLLGYLDRVHQAYTRTGDDRPQQAPWMRSMRGERGSTRKRGVLDTVMIVSVGARARRLRRLVLRLRRVLAARAR